jgi:sulfur carrier protein ThiS
MNCEGQKGRKLRNLPRDGYDRIEKMPVKLILRDKEYEVKPGMTLLSALQKNDIVPESVIATREGEMILEDEILKDGDMIKLIAVISGG